MMTTEKHADAGAIRALEVKLAEVKAELEQMSVTKDIHQRKRAEYFDRAERVEAKMVKERVAARAEGFRAGIEAAARITEDGHRCWSCGQVFLNDNGHSDADCSKGHANWDIATDAQKAAAIRAIDVDEVLAGLRPRCAECDCEDGKCTWIKAGPAPDVVEPLVEAMKHLHDIINCGNCSGSRQSARLALRALAAMETNDDH